MTTFEKFRFLPFIATTRRGKEEREIDSDKRAETERIRKKLGNSGRISQAGLASRIIIISQHGEVTYIRKRVSMRATSPEVVHELEIARGGDETTHKRNKTGASRVSLYVRREALTAVCLAYKTTLANERERETPRGRGTKGLGTLLEFRYIFNASV